MQQEYQHLPRTRQPLRPPKCNTNRGQCFCLPKKRGTTNSKEQHLYNGGGVKNDTLYATGESGDANYFESLGLAVGGSAKKDSTYTIDTQKNIIKLVTNKNCFGYLGSNVITTYATSGSIRPSKIDLQNKIISGTFNCKIPIPNCDTLNITEGRFDIKY